MPRKQKPGSAAHLQALGRITLEYARLEQFMSHYIWGLIARDTRVGQTITAPLNYSNRVRLLRSLFYLLAARGIDANVDGLEAILKRATDAVEDRNAIMHALIWHTGKDGKLQYTSLSKRKPATWNTVSASPIALHQVAEGIYQAVMELSAFMQSHFGSNQIPPEDGQGTLWGGRVNMMRRGKMP